MPIANFGNHRRAMREKPTLATRDRAPWPAVFTCMVGVWLATVLVKLGNPIVFRIAPPANGWELLLNSWPVAWGYVFLAAILPLAVLVRPRKSAAPKWIIALPLVWFCWQLAGAAQTVAGRMTPEQAMENLRVLDETQRLLSGNIQEALTLEVGLLRLTL